jgi:hypothetical protein
MNQQHLRFAQSHDWGREAFLKNGKLFVINSEPAESYGVSRGAWIEFTSFDNLRAWAGY